MNKIYKCDNGKTKRRDTKKTRNKRRSKIKIKHCIIRGADEDDDIVNDVIVV